MNNFQDYISESKKGIWRYEQFFEDKIAVLDKSLQKIKDKEKLNLEQGLTSLENRKDLENSLSVKNLYLKREDLNTLGSFKSRALAYQVSYYKNLAHKNLVISSSGNAGICAAKYCDVAGIKLICLISPNTDIAKKAELSKTNAVVIESSKAMRLANYLSAKYKIPNLRPSVDDISLIGFETLAYEIFEQSGQFLEKFSIYTFVTSGSSLIGIYNGLKKLFDLGFITKIPTIFAVMSDEISLGVKNSRRIEKVIEIVKTTGGQIINITNLDLKMLAGKCLDLSRQIAKESQAVLSAISKMKMDNSIAIIGGKNWDLSSECCQKEFLKAENFEKIDQILKI